MISLLVQKHDHHRQFYDDQQFLYETVSLLIVTSSLDAKIKAQLMRNMLAPVVSTFVALVERYASAPSDEKVRLVLATSLNHAMSVATRVSKGFSNVLKTKDCACTEIFVEVLRIFTQAISVGSALPAHKSLIHAGIRQYMHRMIICIDNEILEYIPVAIEQFLKVSNEPKDVADLVPLIVQAMGKYKSQLLGFLQTLLMQLTNMTLNYVNSLPVQLSGDILRISPQQIQNLNVSVPNMMLISNNNSNILNFNTQTGPPSNHQSLSSSSAPASSSSAAQMNGNCCSLDDTDEMISADTQYVLDIQALYRAFFQFVLNVVNNDLMEIFLNQTGNDIYKVYCALLQGVQIGTPEIAKGCLQCVKKLISFFGKISMIFNLLFKINFIFVFKVDKPIIENFIPFTIQNLVPVCLQVFTQNIDTNDAQQVLVIKNFFFLNHSTLHFILLLL